MTSAWPSLAAYVARLSAACTLSACHRLAIHNTYAMRLTSLRLDPSIHACRTEVRPALAKSSRRSRSAVLHLQSAHRVNCCFNAFLSLAPRVAVTSRRARTARQGRVSTAKKERVNLVIHTAAAAHRYGAQLVRHGEGVNRSWVRGPCRLSRGARRASENADISRLF
jgi:hypothetical protein